MKILIYTNLWMKESDYRFGLITTLQRLYKNVTHVYLSNDLVATYAIVKPDILISIKGHIPDLLKNKIFEDRCKTIQLFPDDPDLMNMGRELYPQFDHFFTNSIEAQRKYIAQGYKDVKVCAFAVDHKLTDGVIPSPEFKCDILFAGGDNHKRYRYTYLNALRGLDLNVYGKWSKDVHGIQNRIIYGTDYFSALKSCKIGIDLSESAAGFMNVKSKTFELASCCTFILVNKFKEMEKYFEYDKEVVGFSTPEELREKCEYYLEHEDERKAIAQAGYKRFMEENTWEHRIKYIFKECDIPWK